ncbi:hypothetical protein FRC17_007165, partial [Serendipita sp. 399]
MLSSLRRTLVSVFHTDLKELYTILERAAPFSAWKTLTITSCCQARLAQMPLHPLGRFTNLEALSLDTLDNPLVPILNNSITNSLKWFQYSSQSCTVDGEQFTLALSNILSRMKNQLCLPNSPMTGLQLPPNVTDLRVIGDIISAEFPHILALTIMLSSPSTLSALPIYFPNLQKLTLIEIYPMPSLSYSVVLPHLESLTVHYMTCTSLKALVAPQLQGLFMLEQKMEPLEATPLPLLFSQLAPQKEFSINSPLSITTLKGLLSCYGK